MDDKFAGKESLISFKSFDKKKPISFTNTSVFEDQQRLQKVYIADSYTPKKCYGCSKNWVIHDESYIDVYDILDLLENPMLEAIIKACDNYVQMKKNTIFERSLFCRIRQIPN